MAGEDMDSSENTMSLWNEDSLKIVLGRMDDAAHVTEDLHKFMAERASLEKKFVKELQKFGKKWHDKVGKMPLVSGSTMAAAWQAAAAEATDSAKVHTDLEQKLEKLSTHVERWRKEHYVKSLGKLLVKKEAHKGFDKARKPWQKALDACEKARTGYNGKSKDVHKLEVQLAQAKSIESATAEAECKKLQTKIDKALKEQAKAKANYEAKIAACTPARVEFQTNTVAEFERCQAKEQTRLEFTKTALSDYITALNFSETELHTEAVQRLRATIDSTHPEGDVQLFATKFDSQSSAKTPEFSEWSDGNSGDAEAAVAAVAEGGMKSHGEWFVKSGEKKKSRSHKRFFLLKGTDLSYYGGYQRGVPVKHKGSIALTTVKEVQCTDNVILLVTPQREWKMTSKKPAVAAEWAGLIAAAAGTTVIPITVPVAPEPHVDLPNSGEEAVMEDEHHEEEAAAAAAVAGTAVVGAAVYTDKHHKAATKIQARYRGYKCRKNNPPAAAAVPVVAKSTETQSDDKPANATVVLAERPTEDELARLRNEQDDETAVGGEIPAVATSEEAAPDDASAPDAGVFADRPDESELERLRNEPDSDDESGEKDDSTEDGENSTEHKAATKIQAHYRGFKTRKHLSLQGAPKGSDTTSAL